MDTISRAASSSVDAVASRVVPACSISTSARQAGEGYSIGVDGDLLGRQIGGGLNFFFGNVVYDRQTQDATVDDVLFSCVEGVNMLTAGLPVADASSIVDEMCRVFRRVIWYPLVTFKDATFAEENEWRAIEIMTRRETATRALRLLLTKHGYSDAEVKGSRIPLRL